MGLREISDKRVVERVSILRRLRRLKGVYELWRSQLDVFSKDITGFRGIQVVGAKEVVVSISAGVVLTLTA